MTPAQLFNFYRSVGYSQEQALLYCQPANKERLLQAVDNIKEGKVMSFTFEELDALNSGEDQED